MKIKENKGITLVALVVAIVILLILSSVVIIEMNTGDKFKDYQYMKADIETIKDSTLIYYHKYNQIPKKGNELSSEELSENVKDLFENLLEQASEKDDANYYEVDLEKLGNITINYGRGNITDGDIYIINGQSQEVYYLTGIEYEGELKHQ